ncbi:MAG: SMC-Scp complex subunit ScpB [Gammaproteobacteria bacterium]
MDEREIKNVLEAALLAVGRPLSLDQLSGLFGKRGAPSRDTIRAALATLTDDYADRGIELKRVASGYRIQIRRSMGDWLMPLWEERAPRYSRALLETLSLVAYRQPITRGEIEEVRGVAVSTNIVRTLQERGWVRVVGHRDVPGKPAMFGTTKEFLDYFGLTKLEDLPPLSEIRDLDGLAPELDFPQTLPQQDFVDGLEEAAGESGPVEVGDGEAAVSEVQASGEPETDEAQVIPLQRPESA